MDDCTRELVDALSVMMMDAGIDGMTAKTELTMLLSGYRIEHREANIVPYTGDNNERLLRQFIVAKRVIGCQTRTLENYYKELHKALLIINKSVELITSEDLLCYIAQMMRRGCSHCYCNNTRLRFSTFFNWLYSQELIPHNPMSNIQRIRYHREPEKAFTQEELERMRIQLRTWREKALYELLLSTGCRVSELCSIKISDIDGNRITILGKGGKYRDVFLNPRAQITVEKYLEERTDLSPYLFFAGRQNMLREIHSGQGNVCRPKDMPQWYTLRPDLIDPERPMNIGSVKDILNRLAKAADVENVHPHRFRRTCATYALRRGMPIELVSKMLGHESIATTQIYLDLDDHALEEAHIKYVT